MIQKHIITNILIILLLACSFVSVSAGALERPIFEKMPDNPNFIVNKGTMPEITNDTEWINWSDSVMRCWAKMTNTSPSYSIFGNAITNIIPAEDFLIVEICSNYTDISNSQIEEIYRKINLFCKQEGVSEIPVTFQWQEGTHFQLPDYGPKAIENAKKDPLFISSRGTMPVIKDNEEKWEWFNQLDRVYSNDGWIHPYITNGPVLGFELSSNGYLIVRLDADHPEKVNVSIIDEIYQEIDVRCRNEGISQVPVVFFWQPFNNHVIYVDHNGYYVLNEENDPNSLFVELESNSNFIAARGTMPVITDEGEKREWLDRLGKCLGNSRDMHQYSKGLGGPMISYGIYIDGYAIVELDRDSPDKVNQSLIDEMYLIIDASCKQEGINDVPVVFEWGETPQEDSAESQIPGFTLPMLILSLLLLVEIKRKVF